MRKDRIKLLTGMLASGIVYIKFTKLNGNIREMNATLNFDLIPEEQRPVSDKDQFLVDSTRKVVALFDLDLQEWRSVNVDRIINYFNQGEV